MAIQQTVVCDNGIIIENGYIKIGVATYNNVSKIAELAVNIFKDKTCSDDGKAYIEKKYYTFTPNLISGVNLLTQGYEYLKTNVYTIATDLQDENTTIS